MAQMGKHPMLDELARGLQHGPDGTLVFPPGALAGFQARALALERGEELYRLVDDVIGLASLLGTTRRSPETARLVMAMLEPVVARLQQLATADGAKSSQRRDELRRKIDAQSRALQPAGGPGAAIGPRPSSAGVGLRKGRR